MSRYIHLLNKRSHNGVTAINTFFYSDYVLNKPLQTRLLSKFPYSNVFGQDPPVRLLLVPIFANNNHWKCGAVNFDAKSTFLYDSKGTTPEQRTAFNDNMQRWLQFYVQRHVLLELTAVNTGTAGVDYPKQINNNDCGMFTVRYMDYLSRGAPLKNAFSESDMVYFRYRTAHELLEQKLLL